MNNWSINNSLEEYQINSWGDEYFGINDYGNLCVYPDKLNKDESICLAHIINEVKEMKLNFPVVFRFHDILRSKVEELNSSFSNIINEAGFKGKYFGVFPIKVNQLREVVEEIVDAGDKFNYGLEAGSKSELMAVLAYNTNKNALTILNGYKDRDYLQLALLGTLIGKNIVIVIEKLSEAKIVIELAESFGIEPILGVRAKLTSKSSGKWADSSGDHAKFGLNSGEILELIEYLRIENKLHTLQLFHFHVGSQIPDIRAIKDCITEGAQIYSSLKNIGVPIKYFDVGGGVGVNYDGSGSNCSSSINYHLQDYIRDVVYILKQICDENRIDHPHIVSETGRAITAHHSCVITNVFDHIDSTKNTNIEITHNENDHYLIQNIKELYTELNQTNFQDVYNDACTNKEQINSAFKLGVIDLKAKAMAENLYSKICKRIVSLSLVTDRVSPELKNLKESISSKYLCNFSLFQSAPDTWAIGQILPIVPISRHNEKPSIECTLADITCDSDGKINNFLGKNGNKKTLKLHPILTKKDYHIGLFLTGAYQDVMGDMHNLFGRLNEVHIFADPREENGFYIEEALHGNTCGEVLKIMQYNPSELSRIIKEQIDVKIKEQVIRPRVGVQLTDFYEACLSSYTYLTP